jgi:hypothetical protein
MRCAPWIVSVTSVVPGQATRRSPVGRTAGTTLRHWWADAARRRPFRRTPAMPRTRRDVIALARKEAPHRLVLTYKSRRPLCTRVNTAPAAIRHRCRHGELPASCVHDGI